MSMWERPFSTVTDGTRYFVVAEVDEKTATRAAELMRDGESDALAAVVANALNLHAMPKLIARARLGGGVSDGD